MKMRRSLVVSRATHPHSRMFYTLDTNAVQVKKELRT